MKIVNIVSSSFPPEVSGGSNRVFSIAKVFDKNNYKVNVVTLGEENKVEKFSDNITITYLQRRNINNIGFIKRAFLEIADTYKLTKKVNEMKAEGTIVSIPYMFLLPIYRVFGKDSNSIIDIRDVVWEYLPNQGIYKIIKKIISKVMYQSTKAFQHITVTNLYEKNLLEKRNRSNNITVINNGIDKEKYELFSNLNSQKSDKIVISYIGCIGLAQNLITLIKAVQMLNNKNIIVNLVGTGNKKDALENYVKEHQLKNIIFHGQKPWKELQKIYSETTILYAQLTKDYDSAVPSKLYEYAATGLPIIYGGVGESKTFLSKLENAKGIEPDNIEELIESIETFSRQKFNISKKNQLLIEKNFVRDNVNLKFLKVIKLKKETK